MTLPIDPQSRCTLVAGAVADAGRYADVAPHALARAAGRGRGTVNCITFESPVTADRLFAARFTGHTYALNGGYTFPH